MSKQSPDEAMAEMDTTIEDELNTILPGSEPLANLHARHEGGLEYSVLSARNGGATYHYVELGSEPSCTCDDFEFNVDGDGDRNVCAHIARAYLADRMDTEATVAQAMLNHGHAMESSAGTLKDVAGMLEDAVVKMRDASAGQTSSGTDAQPTQPSGSSGGGDPRGEPDTPDASDAAERLQSAFDDAVDGMAVEANAGVVWLNKTPQAPDYTFDAFLSGPDAVEYVHDEHDLKGEEPGQYFSNYLEIDDVDDYINEVLE